MELNWHRHHQCRLNKAITKIGRYKPGDGFFFGNGENINHVAIVTGRNNKDLELYIVQLLRIVKLIILKESDYWSSRTLFAVDVISK